VTRKRRGGVKRGPRRKEGKDTRKMNNKEVRSRLPHGRTTGKDKVMVSRMKRLWRVCFGFQTEPAPELRRRLWPVVRLLGGFSRQEAPVPLLV
jgi:hypothetical protein